MIPLHALGQVVTGSTPKTSEADFYGGSIPFVTPGDLHGFVPIEKTERYLTQAGASKARLLPEGSVMVSCIGLLGKVGVAGRAVATNQQINSVIFGESIFPRYGFYACRTLAPELERHSTSTTLPIVNKSRFADLEIPVPPLAEQKRIAATLDQVDILRAKRRETISLLDNLTQSIFLDMFGDGEWPVAPLSRVVRDGTVVTYGIVQAGEEFPGGVPYIRTGDIKRGQILTAGLRRTDPVIASKFDRSRVLAGDIVMSIRATVGTVAPVPPDLDGANLTQGTARISPGALTQGIYLLEYLRSSKAQFWIQNQVKGATFREITLAKLRELEVPLPPMALQNIFAERMQVVLGLRNAHSAHLAALDELFESVQQRAFAGRLWDHEVT